MAKRDVIVVVIPTVTGNIVEKALCRKPLGFDDGVPLQFNVVVVDPDLWIPVGRSGGQNGDPVDQC